MSGFNLSRWAIEHAAFSRFLVVLCLGLGAVMFFHLGHKEDPEFEFRFMEIRARWPGATASEMEEQVAKRIELALQETADIEYTYSQSKAAELLVTIRVRDDIAPSNIKPVWYQVRKKVGDIRHKLPPGVEGPFFNDDLGDTYSVVYGVTGDGMDFAELKSHAERLRTGLLQVAGVERVDLLGVQPERVYVTVSHRRLQQLGIDAAVIAKTIAEQNGIEADGVVDTATEETRFHVEGGFMSWATLRDLPLRIGTATIRLSDIAEILPGYQDPPTFRMRVNNRDAIGLGVIIPRNGNVAKLGPKLEAAMRRLESELPLGVQVQRVADQSTVVHKYVGEFLSSLLEAIIIILAVSFISLGWRAGLVVALTIPLVLAVTFACMDYFGIALQKVSLGALIIALGLLVDDSVIAVEMMARKLEEGLDKLSAAAFSYTSTAFPMLTGTLITIAGFLPVGLAQSMAGEYMFSIFAVVAIALTVSWFAAVYFTPFLGYTILHTPKRTHSPLLESYGGKKIRAFVGWSLHKRKTVIALSGVVLVLALIGWLLLPKQFFPSSNRVEVLADIWLPEGAAFSATDAVARRVAEFLANDRDVVRVNSYIGGSTPRFYLPLDLQVRSHNYAQLVIVTADIAAREGVITRLRQFLNQQPAEVLFRVARLNTGPPVDWPVQFRVRGENPAEVQRIAEAVKDEVRRHPAAFKVHDNWGGYGLDFRFEVDQERARALGVSSRSIRTALATVTQGVEVGALRKGDESVPIVLRAPREERGSLSEMPQVYVRSERGAAVPLSQVARLQPSYEPAAIWHRNRLPTLIVRADIPDGWQPTDVSASINRQLEPLRLSLPPGYSVSPGGALEESNKGENSLYVRLPLVVGAILTLLMMQLQHFGRTALVFATAPLGVIGSVATLWLFGAPFGFTATLGVIALSGMIIRNSVILVDQIEREFRSGKDIEDAIVTATIGRFRPILLTAAAAALALIPLASNVFWGAMSIAMIGGLLIATFLTLSLLPALYYVFFANGREATSPPPDFPPTEPAHARQ